MKNTHLTLILLCCALRSAAQTPENTPCQQSKSQAELHANNIQARFLGAGDMFWDFKDAKFIPNPSPTIKQPATIHTAALWLGGIDPSGNFKLSANTYRNGGKTDFWSGPLAEDGFTDQPVCAAWDRHFKVRGAEIASFQANLAAWAANPAAAIAQHPNIMGWPGYGNPYFSTVGGFNLPATPGGLAPFFDKNEDGIYNPLQGDYPAVQLRGFAPFVPAEMIWWVFNDEGGGAPHTSTQGSAFPMEVQATAWAFQCLDKPVLNNTIFTSHKMIYRGTEQVDSCFVGMWADFDLGCPYDDYIGCDSTRSTMYVYNRDMVDGSSGANCDGGIRTFADAPPVQSATFLGTRMEKFIYIGFGPSIPPAAIDPTQNLEFYHYLTGSWRDGSPLTAGGNGYGGSGQRVNYAFPDDPANPNGWSMCTANLSPEDLKGLGIRKIGTLLPGQVEELNMAWTYHPRPNNAVCDLGPTLAQVDSLRLMYDQFFSGVCSGLSAAHDLDLDASVQISPNPADQAVTLQYAEHNVLTIRCFDVTGRAALLIQNPSAEQTEIDVTGLVPGVYMVQLTTPRGNIVRKLMVE